MAPPERPRRAPRPASGRPAAPRRGPSPAAGAAKRPFKRQDDDEAKRPYQRRTDGAGGERKPYQRRTDGPGGERKPYARRDDGGERKPYQRRSDAPGGERKPYQRRTDGPGGERKPYARRDDGAERKPYQRRSDGPGGERKPYQRRTDGPGGERKPYVRREDGDRRPPRRDDRGDRGPRREAAPIEENFLPKRKGWGGVTRRGARQVTNPTPMTDEAKAYEKRESSSRSARPTADQWEREPRPVPAPRARKKPATKEIRAKALPADVVKEVASAAPTARRAPMLQKRLGDAARHMQHGRDREAAGILRELSQEVPEAASVRELYGQVLYSLGRYKAAVTELEAFVDLTASTDQHPMLADSYRALGRHKKVQELWVDLKESSPAPDIVAEGRIVAAGSLADQGKLSDAIRLLETAPPVRGRVHERHLRTWFALADLYERSGELSKARAGFQRVRREDPDFVDVDDRLRALG